MNIKEISKEIYKNNAEKGFWDEKRNVAEMLMLVVSELSEALEGHRLEGNPLISEDLKAYVDNEEDDTYSPVFESAIKNKFQDEIADAVIRLFDISEGTGIDLEWHIAAKMRYNKLRPYKHGKAY